MDLTTVIGGATLFASGAGVVGLLWRLNFGTETRINGRLDTLNGRFDKFDEINRAEHAALMQSISELTAVVADIRTDTTARLTRVETLLETMAERSTAFAGGR